jgi:hypothetical protein
MKTMKHELKEITICFAKLNETWSNCKLIGKLTIIESWMEL